MIAQYRFFLDSWQKNTQKRFYWVLKLLFQYDYTRFSSKRTQKVVKVW